MRDLADLAELVEKVALLAILLGGPLLLRVLQRLTQGRSGGPAPRDAGAPPRRGDEREPAELDESLRRGRELFERLARGEPVAVEPPPLPREPERAPEPSAAAPAPRPDAAGSLAGLPPPESVDEERAARESWERELARARAAQRAGAALEERAEAGGLEPAALASELGVAPPMEAVTPAGSEISAGEISDPPLQARRPRRLDLRAAVLAAELLGPPLALRALEAGASAPRGLDPT